MYAKDSLRQKGVKPAALESGARRVSKPRHHGSGPKFFSKWVTRDILQKHFHLPMEQAALTWSVSTTIVKRVCRTFGIERWPYRQIQSAYKAIVELEKKLLDTTRSSPEKEKIKAHMLQLKAKIDDLRVNPNPAKKRPSSAIVSRGPERAKRAAKRTRRAAASTAPNVLDGGGAAESKDGAVLDGDGCPALAVANPSVPCGVERSLAHHKTVSRAAARAIGAFTASTAGRLTASAKRRAERSAAAPASIPVAASVDSLQTGPNVGKGTAHQTRSRGAYPPNSPVEVPPSTPSPSSFRGGPPWDDCTQERVGGVDAARRARSLAFGVVDVARVSGDGGAARTRRSLSSEGRSGAVDQTVGHPKSIIGLDIKLAHSAPCPPPGAAQTAIAMARVHQHQQQQEQYQPSDKLGRAKVGGGEGVTLLSRSFCSANTPADMTFSEERGSFRVATPPYTSPPWGTLGRGVGTLGTLGSEDIMRKPAVATTLEDASLAAILLDIDIPEPWSPCSGSSSTTNTWPLPLEGSSGILDVNLDANLDVNLDEAVAFIPGDLFPEGGFLADTICGGIGQQQQGDLW